MPGGAKPDLVIPLRFDGEEALRLLRKLQQDGRKAGEDTAEGLDKATKSSMSLGDHLMTFVSHQGLQVLQSVAQGMSKSFEETSNHIKQIGEQFIQLRETMRGIQALQGKAPTDAATAEQIKLSEKAQILSPQEFATAQEAFLQYGSGYVSKPGQPGTGRIEQSTVDEILPELMGYAKARKVSPDVASRLISALIQTMPKGSAAEDYKAQFMKVMEIAETSKGSAQTTLSQLAPLLAEGVGEGMAFGNGPDAVLAATRLIAVEQERNPEEAFTYSRALLQELHHIHAKEGAEDQLGIKEGMTVEEKVKAIGEAYKKSGAKSFADFIGPLAGDKIRGTGALQTALNQGVVGGQFEVQRKAAEGVGAADLGIRMQEFMASEGGVYMKTEAENAREQALAGQRYAEMNRLKLQAEAQLNREGRFEDMSGWGDTARGIAAQGGAPSVKQQLINEQAVRLAQQQAGLPQSTIGNMGDAQYVIDKQILDALKLANEQRAAQAARPLAAPPPKPETRTAGGG